MTPQPHVRMCVSPSDWECGPSEHGNVFGSGRSEVRTSAVFREKFRTDCDTKSNGVSVRRGWQLRPVWRSGWFPERVTNDERADAGFSKPNTTGVIRNLLGAWT